MAAQVNLLAVPAHIDDIDFDLEWRVKPDWKGFWGHLAGLPIQFLAWLKFGPAVKFMTNYTNIIAGVMYLRIGRKGPPDEGTRLHEGVHHWQGKRWKTHALRVTLDPRGVNLPILRNKVSWRAHTEAMAYAFNVVLGHLTFEQALEKLIKPAYATGLNEKTGRTMLFAYTVSIRRNTVGAPTS